MSVMVIPGMCCAVLVVNFGSMSVKVWAWLKRNIMLVFRVITWQFVCLSSDRVNRLALYSPHRVTGSFRFSGGNCKAVPYRESAKRSAESVNVPVIFISKLGEFSFLCGCGGCMLMVRCGGYPPFPLVHPASRVAQNNAVAAGRKDFIAICGYSDFP